MQLPAKQCTIRIGFPVVLGTDRRTEESDVITLRKFLALAGYQIFLPARICARTFSTPSSAIKMIVMFPCINYGDKIYRVLAMEIHFNFMTS